MAFSEWKNFFSEEPATVFFLIYIKKGLQIHTLKLIEKKNYLVQICQKIAFKKSVKNSVQIVHQKIFQKYVKYSV